MYLIVYCILAKQNEKEERTGQQQIVRIKYIRKDEHHQMNNIKTEYQKVYLIVYCMLAKENRIKQRKQNYSEVKKFRNQ